MVSWRHLFSLGAITLFLIGLSLFQFSWNRAPASNTGECSGLATYLIQGDSFTGDSVLTYFMDRNGVVPELSKVFEADLRSLYPHLSDEKFMDYHYRYTSEFTKKADELVTALISYPSNNYYKKSLKVRTKIEEYDHALRVGIFKEIDSQLDAVVVQIKLTMLIDDSSIKLMPDYSYHLAHRGMNPTDHIDYIIFNEHSTEKLNRDANLRIKMLKACRRGVVNHAHNSNGIKRIGDELFEVKDVTIDKRLWGCMKDGVLTIRGLTDHKGISRVEC